MRKKTGILYDESYNWHNTGYGVGLINCADDLPGIEWLEPSDKFWYESTDRLRPMRNILIKSGFINELEDITPRMATKEELMYAHPEEYIDRIKELSDGSGGLAGVHTMIGKGSYEIISTAVGGALTGLDAIMEGRIHNAYSLSRPPAGHAFRSGGLGFCPVNTYNILTYYARKKYGLKKIAIVDYDNHFKHGINEEWYSDPDTLYIETHQSGTFEAEGPELTGEGAGEGFTVSIPLPTGSGDYAYVRAFEEIVAPIVNQFKPELIILVSGFAANLQDQLGGQQITSDGYKRLAEIVTKLADDNCGGKLVAIQEGGWSGYLPFCFIKVMEGMSGKESIVIDPFQAMVKEEYEKFNVPELPPSIDQCNAIDAVKEIQKKYWKL